MKCSDLIGVSRKIDINNIQLLAVLIVYILEKCIGRVSLSKRLGLSERSARKMIDQLRNSNLLKDVGDICICKEFIDDYSLSIETINTNMYDLSLVSIEDSVLINYIDKHIVELRDYIVIKTQNPQSIEVIGYYNGLEYVIPGLPLELLYKYTRTLREINIVKNTLFIIWRNYVKYYYEAAVLSSLYSICLNIYK